MYARVVSAQANPKQTEEVNQLRVLGESLAANAAAQPGNRGFLGLMDWSTGKVMAITFWATPQDLEASESSGYLRRQLASAEAILGGPMIRETFEVVTDKGFSAD
jgi:hypothetical protein